MAKASKQNNKVNDKKILKYFTRASVFAIEEALKGVEAVDLLSDIYIKSNDADISYFIKQYEKQLMLSRFDFDKFTNELHNFYIEMAEYIKVNKLYKKFFKLVFDVYTELKRKEVSDKVLTGYQDILMQQFPYLSGSTRKVICGIDSKDKLILVDEVGKYLTEINFELGMYMFKMPKTDPTISTFRKYGYKNIKNPEDAYNIIAYDQIITNMLYEMSYFITEHNKDMIPKPYKNPVNLLKIPRMFAYKTSIVKDIREKLKIRQILLPADGVVVKFANCGEITELLLTETLVDGKVILLWKIKLEEGTYTSGYYNTTEGIFYDMWRDSSHDEITHIPLENFVLQNYMYLTCFLTKEEKANWYYMEDVRNLNVETLVPLASYQYHLKAQNCKQGIGVRYFDRAKYVADMVGVETYIRNLPDGATASEDAIAMASKMGIELPSGKTLVKGFQKKVYHNS